MDFTTFINEEIALGNMGARVDRLFNNPHYQKRVGAYMSSNVNGTAELPNPTLSLGLQTNDITIPQQECKGRIVTLLAKRNPILVRLSDGTEANFTFDQWKRIQGEPALGKTMTIIFQRHPNDATKTHSKIEKVIVTD